MSFLSAYNANTYLTFCHYLTQKLDFLYDFIDSIRNTKDYQRVFELVVIYERIFSYVNTKGIIGLRIERVLNPYYLGGQEELHSGNSTFFIELNIQKSSIKDLDNIYRKKISNLLRLYKNIFTIVNNPNNSNIDSVLLKYQLLIDDVRNIMSEFIFSNDEKELVNKRAKLKELQIKNLPHEGFYHMTHVKNLKNILDNGLLSHNLAHTANLLKVDISNNEIQKLRNRTENLYGNNIQDYVPLYFNPSNPMMQSKKIKNNIDNIILIEIIPHVLIQKKISLFSDGNASAIVTNFYKNKNNLENINWSLLQEGKWLENDDSHRVMCSEVLILNEIEVFYIQRLILKNEKSLSRVLPLFPNHKGIEITISPKYFNS